MAERRLHRISVALFLAIAALALACTIAIVESGRAWWVALAWGAAIAAVHALSVPTPSGKRINLAIGPAVAAVVLLPDLLAVITAFAVGLVGGWVMLRWRSMHDRDADSDYVAEAISMLAFGLVASGSLSSIEGTTVPLAKRCSAAR